MKNPAPRLTVESKVDMEAASKATSNNPRNPSGILKRITEGRIRSGLTVPS